MLVIADHASDDGTEAWPSQATIAKKASCTIRTVQRSVNALCAEGYLRMEKGKGGSINCREDRRPHRYTINLKKLRGDSETGREERDDFDDLNGATFTPDTGRLLRPMNRPIEPSKETDRFDEFWSIYPLKVGKKKAQQAWVKALAEASAEEIVEGARRYREDPNRTPTFTAHPTTWLNAARWGDDPLPERKLAPEEKKARELEEARKRDQRARELAALLDAEYEEQKAKAVPMPADLRSLFRK